MCIRDRSNNKLFFTATDSVNGAELWVSDGTASGTKMVKDINTKATYNSSPTRLTSYKDKVYFIAMDSTSSGIPTYIPVSYTHLDVYKRQQYALYQQPERPCCNRYIADRQCKTGRPYQQCV